MSGKEGAVVRRRRHSGHQDGGEREGKDRERRLLFDVVKQTRASIREFILCIRLGGGMYNLIVVRVRLHAL
jgi:hypothetical protein